MFITKNLEYLYLKLTFNQNNLKVKLSHQLHNNKILKDKIKCHFI